MATNLQSKLSQIRELKSKGSIFEVQAMFEIMNLERTSILWRKSGTQSFQVFLREESGVCTPSRFQAFKRSVGYFDRNTIDKLGVATVCLLANQNAATRARLLTHALEFRKKFGAEPTYQYFSRFLKKPNPGPTKKQLEIYIDVLRKEIKSLGGRVPMMDR
jgi:hypothetical protein